MELFFWIVIFLTIQEKVGMENPTAQKSQFIFFELAFLWWHAQIVFVFDLLFVVVVVVIVWIGWLVVIVVFIVVEFGFVF